MGDGTPVPRKEGKEMFRNVFGCGCFTVMFMTAVCALFLYLNRVALISFINEMAGVALFFAILGFGFWLLIRSGFR